MSEIQVTVVMPAYNCERYIETAITSVLQQRVPLELIIVEDHSTDGTADVIRRFESDERVIYLHNEINAGVSESRNIGIRMAKGKYIAFLDADDYWTEDKLERQVALMEDKKAVLSSTARELMDEEGNLSGKVIPVPDTMTYRDLLKSNRINTSGAMIRTEIAREFLMGQDHLHEDYILWLKVLKKYGMAYGLNEPMLKYRLMKQSKSGDKLKSAKMTWGVYRYMGLNWFQSLYYFMQYAVAGVKKYH
ncbi:MAG: glycosyltransferase family 2 protein [Lachnospiraceae bacterium]|nr:glycosyltransferase family 2 protein [Lachnospiraceae bacterium]